MSERANEKIKLVLEKILDEHLLGAEQSIQNITGFEFPAEDLLKDTELDNTRLSRIFEHLREKGIVDDFRFYRGEDAKYEGYEPFYDYYTVRFPDDFRPQARNYIQELSDDKADQSTASNQQGLILYLDNEGNFWHGDKDKFCYAIGAKSNRLLILKYLLENKGFQTTEDIASSLGGKDKQNIRTEIGKMRDKINNTLGFDDLIESKKDSGYRINPKYKILKS